MNQKLIFVYNADSDLFGRVTNFAHKILSPDTYECNLCKLTYGDFTIKKGWKDFLSRLDLNLEFLHRDEFKQKHPNLATVKLPAIFVLNGEIKTLLTADEINSIQKLESLQTQILNKLNLYA